MKDMFPALIIVACAVGMLVVLVVLGPVVRTHVASDLAAQTVTSVRVTDASARTGEQQPVSGSEVVLLPGQAAPEPFVNVPEAAREALKEIEILTASTDGEE